MASDAAFSSHPGHGSASRTAQQAASEIGGGTVGLAADQRPIQAQTDQGAAAGGSHTEVPANASNRAYGKAK